MSKPWRVLLLAIAYWGGAMVLVGLLIFALGDCGTGSAVDDFQRCLAEQHLVRQIGFGLALVGFPFFLWRLRKEKGPL